MRRCTFLQDSVIRKLSSILPTMRSNSGIGTAKLRMSAGTQGLAETSNIPRTASGQGVELQYSHSAAERIHLGDLAKLVELLVAWCGSKVELG